MLLLTKELLLRKSQLLICEREKLGILTWILLFR